MTLLAILHDVHDAEYVLLHPEIYSTAIFISTHEAVNDYLLSRNRDCISLSSFVSINELSDFYSRSECVYSLLDEMDSQYSSILHKLINNPQELRYFYTLYRYLGRYEYVNIHKIQIAIERLSKKYEMADVHLFSSHFSESKSSFFLTKLNVYKYIIESIGLGITEVSSPLSKKIIQAEKRSKLKKDFRRTYWVLINKLKDVLNRDLTIKQKNKKDSKQPIFVSIKSKKTLPIDYQGVLLLDGSSTKIAYSNLQKDIHETINLVEESIDDHQLDLPSSFHEEFNKLSSLISERSFDPLLFLRTILLDDFISQYKQYISPLTKLIAISERFHILGGAWSSPPTRPSPKALLTAYLLGNETPVFGYQHGGNYGIQKIYSRHFDSDFWWCTHYLSWGFTQEDLKETYPDAEINCKVLPVGQNFTKRTSDTKRSVGLNIKKQVDILFPITNASYFHRDTLRIPQHLLGQYQRDLLIFLNSLKKYSVIVKPFQSFNHKNSAFIELLQSLDHIKVESHLSFTECLETHHIRSLLIEYPSSPMFEAMSEDVEIFALLNPIIKYNPTADNLLKKRVHLYDTLPDVKLGIADFLNGHLPNKRDASFVERYLLPYDDEQVSTNILETLGIK